VTKLFFDRCVRDLPLPPHGSNGLCRRPGSGQARVAEFSYSPAPAVHDSSPVSCLNGRAPRTVSVGALHPGLQCSHAAASAFRQPSPTCRTAFPAQHLGLRLSDVLSCWPDGLELTPTSSTDWFRRLLKTYSFARY